MSSLMSGGSTGIQPAARVPDACSSALSSPRKRGPSTHRPFSDYWVPALALTRSAGTTAEAVVGRDQNNAASTQLAADDVFAAHVALVLAHVERARHGGPHAVRRSTRSSPAVRHRHDLLPIVRTLRDIRCVVDLVEFGRVLRDKAIRLDEVREHVAARPVAADPPFDVKT